MSEQTTEAPLPLGGPYKLIEALADQLRNLALDGDDVDAIDQTTLGIVNAAAACQARHVAVEAALREAGVLLSDEIAHVKRVALTRVHYSRDEAGWARFVDVAKAHPHSQMGAEWAAIDALEQRLARWQAALAGRV